MLSVKVDRQQSFQNLRANKDFVLQMQSLLITLFDQSNVCLPASLGRLHPLPKKHCSFPHSCLFFIFTHVSSCKSIRGCIILSEVPFRSRNVYQ